MFGWGNYGRILDRVQRLEDQMKMMAAAVGAHNDALGFIKTAIEQHQEQAATIAAALRELTTTLKAERAEEESQASERT